MERTSPLSLVSTDTKSRLEERDDDELVQLSALGNQAAFACLVRRHSPLVRSFCARVCGGAAADDVAQHVFVQLHACLRQYQPQGRFRSYLLKIAHHRCKDVLRSQRSRREDTLAAPPELADTGTALDAILGEERRRRLFAVVDELPIAQRTAIQLHFCADLDYASVAEISGCSEPTARWRVFEGLKKLQATLRKRGGL